MSASGLPLFILHVRTVCCDARPVTFANDSVTDGAVPSEITNHVYSTILWYLHYMQSGLR